MWWEKTEETETKHEKKNFHALNHLKGQCLHGCSVALCGLWWQG